MYMVTKKKTAVKKRKVKKETSDKTADIKKEKDTKKVKIRNSTEKVTRKKKVSAKAEKENISPATEHNHMVKQVLTETSPKNQRLMLKHCINRLQKVVAACRPRTVFGTLGLLLLGALIGTATLVGSAHITNNGFLIHLLTGTRALHIDGLPIQIGEEVDTSFRRPAMRDVPNDFHDVDFREFWEVWQYIENEYVPPPQKHDSGVSAKEDESVVTRDDLINGAVKGLTFATEDKYTHFYLPKDAIDFENEVIEGEIEGIGAYLTIDKDNSALEVVKPIEGGPAEQAGLKAGDIITKIDGIDSTRYNLSEAASHIRGPSGTTVLLEIYRSVIDEIFSIAITRGQVKVPTVETEIRDGVFILKLSTFTKLTPQAFRAALEEFVASANEGGPTRLLLDMRGNMGGILSVSIYIAGLFLPENSPVLYEYAGTEILKVYRTNKPAFKGGATPRMTILVDKATASASEILAAALRHYGVADIVGTPTLGKGSVQAIRPVGDNKALLKITIAHWLTPAKESITGEGVLPDVDYKDELKKLYKENQEADIPEIALKKAIQHLKER